MKWQLSPLLPIEHVPVHLDCHLVWRGVSAGSPGPGPLSSQGREGEGKGERDGAAREAETEPEGKGPGALAQDQHCSGRAL